VVQVSSYARLIGHATWKYIDGIIENLWYILKMVVFPLFIFYLKAGFVTAHVKTAVYSFKKYRNSFLNQSCASKRSEFTLKQGN